MTEAWEKFNRQEEKYERIKEQLESALATSLAA